MPCKQFDHKDKHADANLGNKSSLSKAKIGVGLAVLLGLAGLFWVLSESSAIPDLNDKQALQAWVNQLGPWGPLAIIGLMMGAIVMSPVPSGPIAIAAGAVYGTTWGTIWVVIGSEGGALVAFWVSRSLGYDKIQQWARVRPLLRRLDRQRSQTWLMAVVFASRLVPFISFDAVSYAAGLTPLTFWRFALATLLGVIPIAFLLTYFGEAVISIDSMGMLPLLLLSSVTLIPIAIVWLWKLYKKHST